MPRLFKSVVSGTDALFSYLESQFLAAGWTTFAQINTSTSQPNDPASSGNQILGRETLYQINGTDLSPARSYIGMVRSNATYDNAPYSIIFYGFTGFKGPFPISLIVAGASGGPNSAVNTLTTAVDHPFNTGDVISFNGVSNQLFNVGNLITTGVYGPTVYAPDSRTLKFSNNVGFQDQTGSGGYVFALYNNAGSRSTNSTVRWQAQNDGYTYVTGVIDEFRCAFMTTNSGNMMYIQLGQSGRGHIPAAFSDTAFTTNDVTGPGTVDVYLDRSSPNLYSSQYAWLVCSSSALFERAQITVIDDQHVRMTLAKTGTYAAGTLFGDDPCPIHVLGMDTNHLSSNTLDQMTGYFSFFTDGTRTDAAQSTGVSQTYSPRVDSVVTPLTIPDDSSGYAQGASIIFFRSTAPKGVRKNIAGTGIDLVVAWPHFSQSDGDIQQTGKTSDSYYTTHPSTSILNPAGTFASVMDISFGPGQ